MPNLNAVHSVYMQIEQLRNEKDSGDKAVAHYKELITEAEEKLGTLKDDVETLVAENRMLRTELEDGHKENACLTTNIEVWTQRMLRHVF